MEQTKYFEEIFAETSAAIDDLSGALEKYSAVQEKYFELMKYYGGKECGAISPNSIHELLNKNRALQVKILEIFADILRKG